MRISKKSKTYQDSRCFLAMYNKFRKLGKSERVKDPIDVASIAIFNTEGTAILMGKRRDSGKYTTPGGHLEENESPEGGARREAKEEAGIDAHDLTRLGEGTSGKYRIHSYRTVTDQTPTSENDPDNEVETWEWIDISNGLPDKVASNLHAPKNITLRLLGLQKETIEKFEPAFLASFIQHMDKAEWCGKSNIKAKVRIDPYYPGTMYIEWHDQDGFIGHSPNTPVVLDIVKSLTEEFENPVLTDSKPQPLLVKNEIDDLMNHPNPHERSMALKLDGVSPQQIAKGLYSEDPTLQQAALHHNDMKGDLLMLLMRIKNRHALQLDALSRDDIGPDHLSALYDTVSHNPGDVQDRAVFQAIASHPQLNRSLLRDMWSNPSCEDIRHLVVRHPVCPPDILDGVVSAALSSATPLQGSMAVDALKHGAVSPQSLRAALQSNQIGLRLAASSNPDLPPDLIDDILAHGQTASADPDSDAQVRRNALTGYNVTAKHLDNALRDIHPDVRAAVFESPSPDLNSSYVDNAIASADLDLIARAIKSRVATPEQNQAYMAMSGKTDVQKSETLAKSVDPGHFKSIVRATDTAGRDVVDHKGQMDAHPSSIQHFVDNYHTNIVNAPGVVKPHKAKETSRDMGISRKLVYGTEPIAGEPNNTRYMVKPYHEKLLERNIRYQKHPIQGWAEMANQALYHAGGIGHLHQKVHVQEHNMGPGFENEPSLVIKMDHGFKPVMMLNQEKQRPTTDQSRADVRKIAIMDFLTNNHDRHGGNLMYNDQGQILAIDHPRSFQYHRAKRHSRSSDTEVAQDRHKEDNFSNYHFDTAISTVDPYSVGRSTATNSPHPSGPDEKMKLMDNYRPAFEWWGENGSKVRAEMDNQLRHIKNERIREHIRTNFHQRADMLDDIGKFGVENFGDRWYHDSLNPEIVKPPTAPALPRVTYRALHTRIEGMQAKGHDINYEEYGGKYRITNRNQSSNLTNHQTPRQLMQWLDRYEQENKK